METKMKQESIGVDLFAGAGGLSLGFEKAGFRIIYALERDKYAAETYKRNRNGSTIVDVTDILDTKPEETLKRLRINKGDLDIVVGGPPCQGFSITNMRTRNRDNPANQLVYSFYDFVTQTQPKWFLMENVAGLQNFDNGSVRNKLLELFGRRGYESKAVVLDASSFGVPQVRKRVFFIGNRVNRPLDFLHDLAKKSVSSPVTVRQAIDDLPLIQSANSTDPIPYSKNQVDTTTYQGSMRLGNVKVVFNNYVSRNNAIVLERYKHIRQGENLKVLAQRKPELLGNYHNLDSCHQWIYLRLRWDRPSVVISNYRKNMLIHPEQNRGLSVREAARLQSFPDRYIFYGVPGSQQQQVANAVPPLLAYALAVTIKGAME